jgi:hypothetical protein
MNRTMEVVFLKTGKNSIEVGEHAHKLGNFCLEVKDMLQIFSILRIAVLGAFGLIKLYYNVINNIDPYDS